MESTSLKLKASFYTITVLQIHENNLQKIETQLQSLRLQTPDFFKNTPVIIDIQLPQLSATFDLKKIYECLCHYGLSPIGIQGNIEGQMSAIKALHLFYFSKQNSHSLCNYKDQNHSFTSTKIIQETVRSGQQIYASGDIVILGSVSAGAEILSEGNIHVYGKLSGRALAGVTGNKEARIFCRYIAAELVAIAGHYWLYEDFREEEKPSTLYCFYLEKEQLKIGTI